VETDQSGEDEVDPTKYDTLLDLIDEKINTSESKRAEYFRGSLRGVHFRVHGGLEEATKKPDHLDNGSDIDSGDHYIDAFGRGYRNGSKGLKPKGGS
jgi:hypothetical protein